MRICFCPRVFFAKLLNCGHQGFWHKNPAEIPEASLFIRQLASINLYVGLHVASRSDACLEKGIKCNRVRADLW
jgi:hypothetical protein